MVESDTPPKTCIVCFWGSKKLNQVNRKLFSINDDHVSLFVYVEVLRPSQPNGVMSSAVSLPNHTFTGQA